jgi:hypothetical protein
VRGKLTRDSEFFNGNKKNARVLIITTYQSLNARHGPGELKSWLVEHEKMSVKSAERAATAPHPDWPRRLDGLFGRVILDEAQLVKNFTAQTSTAVAWLDASFHVCLSATPLHNSHYDFEGFEGFIFSPETEKLWEPANLQQLGVTETDNPFALPPDHPGRRLILTKRAAANFIWHRSIHKAIQGERLGMIFEQCLIRRSLTSRIPFRTGPRVGEDIPPSHHVIIDCPMTPDEEKNYADMTPILYRKLVTRKNGKLMWNMDKLRRLCLVTSWQGFKHVHASVKAKDIQAAIRIGNEKRLLYLWLNKVAAGDGVPKPFDDESPGPDADLEQKALILLLRSSPRLRAMVLKIVEEVVQLGEKSVVWCCFPAQQALVNAVLRLCNIDCRVLHAALTHEERDRLIKEFNNSPDTAMVLICSYSVNATGLNLQARCRNTHLFDYPLSEGTVQQAVGRLRRLGQRWIVKVFEYRVPNSFNTRQITHTMSKAMPGLVADLDRALFRLNELDDGKVVISNWGLDEDGELVNWADGERPENIDDTSVDLLIGRIMEMMKSQVVEAK